MLLQKLCVCDPWPRQSQNDLYIADKNNNISYTNYHNKSLSSKR